MKKTILISILPLMAFLFFIAAQAPAVTENPDGWPEEIVKILDRSCYDCHSSESSNVKAKTALNFSKWDDYKGNKQIKKLNNISEAVKGKDMPPSKYLKNFPDNAMSDDDINTIVDWANKMAKQLQP